MISGFARTLYDGVSKLTDALLPDQSLENIGPEDTVLVLCRRDSDLEVLNRLSSKVKLVVASDKSKLRQSVKRDFSDVEMTYIDVLKTKYDVEQEVIDARDRINEWLTTISTENPCDRDILFWRPLPEGGNTQRILDAILLIDSVRRLLDKYDPDVFVLPRSLTYRFDDRIISHTVHTSESRLVTDDSTTAESLKTLGVDTDGYYYLRHMNYPIPRYGTWVAQSVNFLSEMASARYKSIVGEPQPGFTDGERTVVAYHRGSKEKHLKDINSVLPRFVDRDGFEARVVTWRDEDGRAKVTNSGLDTTALEQTVPLRLSLKAVWQSISLWRSAVKKRSELETTAELTYDGVALTPLLWPAIRRFFLRCIPDRVALWHAASQYFSDNTPAAIRYAGGGFIIARGIVCRRAVSRVADPYSFNYRLMPDHIPKPYFRSIHPVIDQYFVAGDAERRRLEAEGVPRSYISAVGVSQTDEIECLRDKYSQTDSLTKISVPERELNIYFAPQGGRRGALTEREKRRVTEAVCASAQADPRINVFIKPHPRDSHSTVKTVFENYSCENLHLLEKTQSALHCINAADLVVTKYSLTGLEAFLMNTPVLTVALDDDHWFQQHGDAAKQFQDETDLKTFLTGLASDSEKRARWFESQQGAIKGFVAQNLLSESDPNGQIADHLATHATHS